MTHDSISRREVLASTGAAGLGVLTVGAGTAEAGERAEYNVGIASPTAERVARSAAADVARVHDWDGGKKTITGTFTDEAIDGLRHRPDVRYTEVNGEMHAIAETTPWGIDRIDADVAHDNGETGSGADIAVIDTGIDDDHPDLQANVGEGKAFVGCSGPNCNSSWSDDNDHGTHCAGVADAVNDSEGTVGVSTQATLHAVKVLDKNGSGSYSDIAAGIEYAADQGWHVASLSLGGRKSGAVEDAVEYAHGKGVLLVAAAGNDGPCTDCVNYPAAEPEVVAVSATENDDSLAGYSSTGPEIELAAPGTGIYSTVIGGYNTFSGTSMACPHVSGAGAQLMANGYTNAEARDRLNSTAEDVGLPSTEQGNGLVDVAAALGLDSSDDLGGGDGAPTVDTLSLDEAETDSSDAEFDAAWQVSDADGDLETVELTLTDTDDGETEDSASISVSGDVANGTTRLVAGGEDGSGHTYQVELTATDSNGTTASDTATATESAGGGTAPTVDSLDLGEDNHGGSPHADFDASWAVSDADGDLETVELTLTDTDDGRTEDSVSADVSGSSASGTTDLKAHHDENSGHTYEVELAVTDGGANTASDTATEVEDGS